MRKFRTLRLNGKTAKIWYGGIAYIMSAFHLEKKYAFFRIAGHHETQLFQKINVLFYNFTTFKNIQLLQKNIRALPNLNFDVFTLL